MVKRSLYHGACLIGAWTSLGVAAPQAIAAEGSLVSRSYLIHNHYPSGRDGKDTTQEWAQGFIANLRSDVTPGPIGIGLDLHGFAGVKLDGGKDDAGTTGLLPVDNDGDSRNAFSSAGGAVRAVYGNSELAYGEMTVETPVFDTGDKRLQPEYATGWRFQNRSLPGLLLEAGRFTRFKNQDSSSGHGDFTGYGGSTRYGDIGLVGATWKSPQRTWGGALYLSRLDDVWRQAYTGLNGHWGHWHLDANLYHTEETGDARAGDIDNLAYSLFGRVEMGSHALGLGYQKIQGDTPFDFVGGDSIYLANSVKFADFNGPGERSWQARYQWRADTLGLPGLTFMARYVSGTHIDGTRAPQGGAYNPFDPDDASYRPQQGRGGRHWERDIALAYVLQDGVAKGLSLSVAHVTHRANEAQGGPDLDRVYLFAEYPFTFLL